MHMLGLVLTRLQLLATSAISTVKELIQRLQSKIIGVRTAMQIPSVGSLTNLYNQFVSQLQKLKVLLVQFITLAQSIKAGLINALQSLGAIGLQLQTIVRQIHQLVKDLFKKGK